MKYVHTEDKLYISLDSSVETITSEHPRFDEALELLKSEASDEEVLQLLFGDVVANAKGLLSRLGERD